MRTHLGIKGIGKGIGHPAMPGHIEDNTGRPRRGTTEGAHAEAEEETHGEGRGDSREEMIGFQLKEEGRKERILTSDTSPQGRRGEKSWCGRLRQLKVGKGRNRALGADRVQVGAVRGRANMHSCMGTEPERPRTVFTWIP